MTDRYKRVRERECVSDEYSQGRGKAPLLTAAGRSLQIWGAEQAGSQTLTQGESYSKGLKQTQAFLYHSHKQQSTCPSESSQTHEGVEHVNKPCPPPIKPLPPPHPRPTHQLHQTMTIPSHPPPIFIFLSFFIDRETEKDGQRGRERFLSFKGHHYTSVLFHFKCKGTEQS